MQRHFDLQPAGTTSLLPISLQAYLAASVSHFFYLWDRDFHAFQSRTCTLLCTCLEPILAFSLQRDNLRINLQCSECIGTSATVHATAPSLRAIVDSETQTTSNDTKTNTSALGEAQQLELASLHP